MAPKTHFTIPLNKASDKGAPSELGRQTTWMTERISLGHPSMRGTSSKPSESHTQVHKHAELAEDEEIAETVETYPLQFTEDHRDGDEIEDVEEGVPPSNVSTGRPIRTIHSSFSGRHL